MTRLVTITLGLLTAAFPLPWAPAWTYPLAALGALAVLTPRPLTRAPVLAVTTAIIAAAFSAAGALVLTAGGLFILAYLMVTTAPPALPDPASWLRHQLPLLAAALIATGASLAAFAIHPAASPWITVTGIAAAVAAYLIALPRRPAEAPAPARHQASISSDASS
jgi:hypothetical protein